MEKSCENCGDNSICFVEPENKICKQWKLKNKHPDPYNADEYECLQSICWLDLKEAGACNELLFEFVELYGKEQEINQYEKSWQKLKWCHLFSDNYEYLFYRETWPEFIKHAKSQDGWIKFLVDNGFIKPKRKMVKQCQLCGTKITKDWYKIESQSGLSYEFFCGTKCRDVALRLNPILGNKIYYEMLLPHERPADE